MYKYTNKCDVTIFVVLSFMRSWLVGEESCGSCQSLVNQIFVELLYSALKTSASGLYLLIIFIIFLAHQHKAAGMKIKLSKNNDHDGLSHGVKCSQEGDRIPPLKRYR